jgi:uncharacterized membrane protein YGL010W
MDNPIAIFSLEIGAAVLFWLVIVVVETAVFQFMSYGDFRQCLRAALIANLATALIVAAALMLIQRFNLNGLAVAGLAAVLVEGLVLNRLKPGPTRQNWLTACVSNLASFAILIFPVYFYAT